MTNLICPLCGRRVNLSSFDPTGYDLDITAVEVKGLGYGRGFKEVSNSSILSPGDPTVELIKNRILDLSKMLLDCKCLEPKEVYQILPYRTDPGETAKKDKIIEDLTGKTVSLKSTIIGRDRIIKSLTNEDISLNSQINGRDKIIEELTSKNIEANQEVSALKQSMAEKDKIAVSLTEEIVKLGDDKDEVEKERDHRLEQARELRRIARSQKEKIDSLEEQVREFSEGWIQ